MPEHDSNCISFLLMIGTGEAPATAATIIIFGMKWIELNWRYEDEKGGRKTLRNVTKLLFSQHQHSDKYFNSLKKHEMIF